MSQPSGTIRRMEDVTLRPVETGDLEVFYHQQRDPEAALLAAFPSREREPFMTHWTEKVLPDPDCAARTVLADGEVAGYICSWDQDGHRMTGYWYGREFWGRGIGTAGMRQYLRWETRRPLYADPATTNTGSVRLLARCGFRTESVQQYPGMLGGGPSEHAVMVLD